MVFVTITFSSLYNNYYIDNNIYHYLQNCIYIRYLKLCVLCVFYVMLITCTLICNYIIINFKLVLLKKSIQFSFTINETDFILGS